MNPNKKDIVTGFIVVVLIIGGVYLYKYLKGPREVVSTSSPASYEFKKDFADNFKLNIPDDVNSIELKDVSGSDNRGIATDNEILVDASEPDNGEHYEAWLQNDNNNIISLGKLLSAKGGWLLEYDRSKYPGYSKVFVSLEKVKDNVVEKRILEGSF